MEELMLKIDNVSKKYKLGEIGGTSLRDELQRLSAKLHHREDPTKKIGAKDYNKGEIFMALSGISLEVKKGERVGIIGHNGAGKSTLLKLISRVTAPTEGTISMNGRIVSMLEVGTGFHAELTGRENVYMNGAILGMTKKEIDSKMQDIIDFSEVAQFIDTPVKRYSSGMYVKLAFSVAAHLDSEIMIMDEVLAVGDMAFQKKCIDKMNQVSKEEGRTILYVSHNMNTIRQLCDRVVVLDHGKVIFNGDVEEGIGIYCGLKKEYSSHYQYVNSMKELNTGSVETKSIDILNKNGSLINKNEELLLSIILKFNKSIRNVHLRMIIKTASENIVGTSMNYNIISGEEDKKYKIDFEFDTTNLVPGLYTVRYVLFTEKDLIEVIEKAVWFSIMGNEENIKWSTTWWGSINLSPVSNIQIIEKE